MTISTVTFLGVGVGTTANDGTGDDLRTAFQKVNANFGWISNTGFNAGNISATGEIDAATATVTGNVTAGGNLVRAGGSIDSGYQYYAITGNTSITANVNVSRVILDPNADAYGVKFTLPGGNVDAKVISLSSTANIAGLQPIGSTGTTVVPSVNVAIAKGTSVSFFYHATETKWYKID